MKLLFIDCFSLQCSRREADAGGRHQAERGPEEALLLYVPKTLLAVRKRRVNVAFYEAWRGGPALLPSAFLRF